MLMPTIPYINKVNFDVLNGICNLVFFYEIDRLRQLSSICTCFIHVQMHDAHRVNVAKKRQQNINKIMTNVTRVVCIMSIGLLLF